MRLFISINFSEASIRKLESWQKELQAKGVEGYWRKGDNLHLTLRFLGELTQQESEGLQEALRKSADQIGSVELVVNKLGVFPNMSRPRILWVGINKEPKLLDLQKMITDNTREYGTPEDKPFKPHLTLASGGIRGLDPSVLHWGERQALKEKVTRFHLMHSLVEKGSRQYIVRESYTL